MPDNILESITKLEQGHQILMHFVARLAVDLCHKNMLKPEDVKETINSLSPAKTDDQSLEAQQRIMADNLHIAALDDAFDHALSRKS